MFQRSSSSVACFSVFDECIETLIRMKRVRFSNSSKHARWARNGASACNPQSRRHRDNVMQRYTDRSFTEKKDSDLALERLSNFSLGDKSTVMDDFDTRTIDTSFSAFSAASCVSFRGIERHWNSIENDPLAREICSLAGMLVELNNEENVENKDSNKADESSKKDLEIEEETCDDKSNNEEKFNHHNAVDPLLRVKQFGVLFVILENEATTDITLSAAYYLLSLIISKINPQFLRDRYSDLIAVFRRHMTKFFKADDAMPVKSCLVCFVETLSHQPMKTLVQSEQDAELMVSYVHHNCPKVRKTCFRLVSLFLANSDVIIENVCTSEQHPFTAFITKHAKTELMDHSKASQFRMRMLNLLKVIVPFQHRDALKASLETCLSVSSGTHLLLKKKCFEIIQNVFLNEPSEELINAKMNGQLLSALDELRPSFFDEELMLSWLAAFEAAFVNLSILDAAIFSSHLLSFLSFCVTTAFVSEVSSVVNACGQVCCRAFTDAPESLKIFWQTPKPEVISCIPDIAKVGSVLKELTNFKYSSNFGVIFHFIGKVYVSLGEDFFNHFKPSLLALCALKTNETQVPALRLVLEDAVCAFGPELFLETYPLNITGAPGEELFRSWVLTLLISSIKSSKLSTWQKVLYPVAQTAESHFEALFKDPAKLKTLQVLASQIWYLLPVFCKNCTDALESFTPGFAKHLSTLIGEKHRSSLSILEALSNLLRSENKYSRSAVVKFSRNYLPQFFNMYLEETTEDVIKVNVLKVSADFMANIPKDQLKHYVEGMKKRVDSNETSEMKKKLLVDLLREVVPFLEPEEVRALLTQFVPQLWSLKVCQKKVVMLIKKVLNTQYRDHDDNELDFDMSTMITDIKPMLLKKLDTGSVGTRKQIYRCLLLLMEKCVFKLEDLNELLPRVVLSLHVERKAIRLIGVKLFKASCNFYLKYSKLDKPKAVFKLIKSFGEGLEISCNDRMVATLIALQYLVALYQDCITDSITRELFALIAKYMKSAKKPHFFEPALHLLKVLISALHVEQLAKYCKKIVSEICEWNRMTGLVFRGKVKVVLFRLAKKMGPHAVHDMCPEDHKKLASSIRKQLNKEEAQRKQSNKSTKGSKYDETSEATSYDIDSKSQYSRVTKAETIADILKELESSDDEGNTSRTSKMTSKSRKSNATSVFLHEGKDGVVDLTDTKMSRYLSSRKPSEIEAKKETSKKNELKFAADGRLLLMGDDGKYMGAEKDEDVEDNDMDFDPERQLGIKSDTSDTEVDSDEAGELSKKKKRKLTAASVRSEASSLSNWFKSKSKPKNKQARGVQRMLETGATFRASKAGGDVKVEGKPDPYAFVPLDPRALNKRKAKKLEGQLKGLVKSSRKGVLANKLKSSRLKKSLKK